MNTAGLIFLLLSHFLSGRGLLAMFRIKQKPVVLYCLSMISGVLLASISLQIIEFARIPITRTNVAVLLSILTILFAAIPYRRYDYGIFKEFKHIKIKIRLYEWLFMALIAYLIIISAWWCFYLPPYARDILSGPEALAEFAVREKTLINSIFTLDLKETNNHLKPPFIVNLQIIYKLLVFPFGQLWLSVIASSFLIWLYQLMKEKLHPFIVGVLMIFFMVMPDPFAYTYIILFDYCNMVLFFAGFYFLYKYFESGQYNLFLFSGIMFGFSTFTRLDTIVLIAMIVPLIVFHMHKNKVAFPKIALRIAVFLSTSVVLYLAWTNIYIKYYMPVQFDVSQQLNQDLLGTIPKFFERFIGMNSRFMFGGFNLPIFGWFINLFAFIFLIDLVFIRSFNREAKNMLYGILVVYIGLPLLGYLIPWFDLDNTTKRGLYKMLPLMMIYMRNSGVLTKLSTLLQKFEDGSAKVETKKVQPVKVAPKPAVQGKNKK